MENVSIEDIMASLDKDTKAGLRFGDEMSKENIPTASYSLNQMIGGGLRLGKQHTFWGGEGTGKTGLLLQTVGLAQAQGIPCAWIDAEGIYDPEWAEKLGVQTDKLLVSKMQSIPEATDQQIKLIQKGVRLIVIDSTSQLWPKSFLDKSGELKNFDETAQLGQQAKDLGQMSRMVNGMNYTCAIVHISQRRTAVGSPAQNKPDTHTGGREIFHNDALRVRLMGTTADANMLKDKFQRGTNLVEEIVGFPVDFVVQKNRLNGNIGPGKYDFFKREFGPFKPGVSYVGEVLDMAVAYGIVSASTWYTVYEEKMQGRKNTIKYLAENPDILQKLENDLEQSF
jgi:recombination protein RecA